MFRLILALGLALAVPAAALDLTRLTPAEQAALDAAIHDYIVRHPEVLVEAAQALEAKQAQAQTAAAARLVAQNARALFDDPASWVGGNPAGDVTLVEFMDYRCPYCRKAYEAVSDLVQSDGKIRFIVKEYPILGPQSELASRFAVAVLQAAGPEAYAKLHDALMNARGEITPEALGKLATRHGLDAKDLLARMSTAPVNRVIDANRDLGDKLAIQGTPTFVIGDQLLRGYVPEAELKAIVAKLRKP